MNAPAMTKAVAPIDLQRGDAFAQAWLGRPFQWDGRSPVGVDCWGLVVKFYQEVRGETLPDWAGRRGGSAWVQRAIAGEARDHWRPLDQPTDGCMVKCLAHVGIYWRGDVLHSTLGAGVVLQRLAGFCDVHPGCEFGEFVP
jgi:cell wall-associated NlpC family hydrolase